jgi:hypothetical protein
MNTGSATARRTGLRAEHQEPQAVDVTTSSGLSAFIQVSCSRGKKPDLLEGDPESRCNHDRPRFTVRARWFPAPAGLPEECGRFGRNVLANDVGEIDGEAPAGREHPKALAHAGLNQVMPVLVPREPVVEAVVCNAAVVWRTGYDQINARVRQRKRTRIAMPHLHAGVVVDQARIRIDREAMGWYGSSS